MVVAPASTEARIAAIDSRSSAPPHIHPPTAQAPKITGETVTSDAPRRRIAVASKGAILPKTPRAPPAPTAGPARSDRERSGDHAGRFHLADKLATIGLLPCGRARWPGGRSRALLPHE